MTTADVSHRTIPELVSLVGRRAVVTGAARGIGYAIARRLTEAGAVVMVGDVADTADAVRRLATEFGGHVVGTSLDVSDSISIRTCVQQAVEHLGGVDIWVNNAAIYPVMPFPDLAEDLWDRVLNVNLRGTFLASREAAKTMIAAGRGGVIVNLASTAAFRAAAPGIAHYTSSKFAVRGLTQSLALELGPHGIRVLAIAPTQIRTPGTEAVQAEFQQSGLGDVLEAHARRLPLGRVGVPDDIARVALFCVSDLAAYMTGSTLLVDAGELTL